MESANIHCCNCIWIHLICNTKRTKRGCWYVLKPRLFLKIWSIQSLFVGMQGKRFKAMGGISSVGANRCVFLEESNAIPRREICRGDSFGLSFHS